MTNLQQRKNAIEKEMKEIAILERLESERNSESEKIKLISRLLLNLHDQPLACGLPIGTVAHVKMIFDASCETCTTCYFANTCEEIVSLTSKGKRKNSRKSSGKSSKIATEKFRYKVVGNFPSVIINILESPLGKDTYPLTTSNCKGFRKVLTDKFKPVGITGNQVSGLTKILNTKGFSLK